ncbi:MULTISPECIES: hypothetical protein [unclassified Microcoleus]|uniref:hypothetical protein n=1 Tax=unclassified Microcoleus TaxID=2642155 RepID=UPI002FD5DCF2
MIQFVRPEMHGENLAFCPQPRTLAATPVSDEAGFSLTASGTNRSLRAGRESRHRQYCWIISRSIPKLLRFLNQWELDSVEEAHHPGSNR